MDFPASSLALVFSFIFGNFGLPVGIPPVEDARMHRFAPDECLYYLSWAGSGSASKTSKNRTERLVADFSTFVNQLNKEADKSINNDEIAGPLVNKQLSRDFLQLAGLAFGKHTSVYVRKATLRSARDLRGAIIVSLGNQTEKAAPLLARIKKSFGPAVKSVQIGNASFSRLQSSPLVPTFVWGLMDRYLIFAVGDGEVEDALRRVKTEAPPWLTQLRKRLSVPRISMVSHVNGKGGFRLLQQMNHPQLQKIIKGFGVDEVQSLALVTGLDAEGYVERALLQMPGNRKGIWTVFDNKPLTGDDLKIIPFNSQVAVVARFDLARAMAHGEALFGKTEPALARQISFSKLGLETLLGFRIQQDLLSSLGDKWYLYNVPDNGSLLTSWTVATNIRQRETLLKIHEKLLEAAKRAGLEVRQDKIAGHDVYCILNTQLGIFPSWCFTKKHLVIGMFPQVVASFVEHQRGGGRSLADRPEVAAMLKQNPQTSLINFTDSRGLAQWVYPLTLMGWQTIAGETTRQGVDLNVAIWPSVNRFADNLRNQVTTMSSVKDGLEWRSRQSLPAASVTTTLPVVAGFTFPAISAARTAARRVVSANRLKQIAIGLHNFHATHTRLPAAYTIDRNGKPLLSWRVMILPYVGENELYKRFKLDEPWDSPHNKKLIARMPNVYQTPASKLPIKLGKTNFLAFRVKNGVLVKPARNQRGKEVATGIRFDAITDGTARTIMVVEASDSAAKVWTKPDDFVPVKTDWRKGLFGLYPQGVNVALADGQTRLIGRRIEDAQLRGMVLRNE